MRFAFGLVFVLVLLAPTAKAGVSIADDIDLDQAGRMGAIGLAVPGAGSTVTRDSALDTLLTGEVVSSFTGGTSPRKAKLELGGSEPPTISVTLPPEGRTRNDRRYPIWLEGPAGTVLTSSSTRIDGLVSLADVANGKLRTVEVDDPRATLVRLDRRIERNGSIRMPLTLALVFGSIAAALLAPRWAPRLVLLALSINLWLAGWWLVALLGAVTVLLPLELACASVLVAYVAVLGLDPEAAALSPFGPSQAGRFYGLSNLLSTWLLVPALLAPALLRRRAAIAVAVLAVVAVGGNRFGADGGGLLVLLVAYGVLTLRRTQVTLTAPRVAVLAAAAVVAGVALVALDAALGGSSHVTAALGDGPSAVLDDLGRRFEASFNRATSGTGAVVATLIGLGGLVFMGTRRGRGPATDAAFAAILVSLLVNDTPTDVASVGATVVFIVHRFEGSSRLAHPASLDRLRAMRRSTIALAALFAALLLVVAGCGGEEATATPETVVGEIPTQTEPNTDDLPALALKGDATNGKTIFAAQGCGACHTLAAAGSSGNIGPNLDEAKPSYELVVERVTLGLSGMPAFGDKLQPQEIADVAEFVSSSAGG